MEKTRASWEAWLAARDPEVRSELAERAALLRVKCEANAGVMYELLREAMDLVPRVCDDDPMVPALVDWMHQVRAIVRAVERSES